jgi:hypothetical protein
MDPPALTPPAALRDGRRAGRFWLVGAATAGGLALVVASIAAPAADREGVPPPNGSVTTGTEPRPDDPAADGSQATDARANDDVLATHDTSTPDETTPEVTIPDETEVQAPAPAPEACGSPTPDRPDPTTTVAGWTELTAPPEPRARATPLWAGDRLLLIGGDTNYGGVRHSDVFAYEPADDAWTCLPPVPGVSGEVAAAWTGREVYVVGDGAAAVLRQDDTWEPLPPPPLRQAIGAVWTGAQLLVYSADDRAAALDPRFGTWHRVPDPPISVGRNAPGLVWTGRELIVRGASNGAALDPTTGGWRELRRFSVSGGAYTVAWTGRRLVTLDHHLRAGAYDPAADRWERLPDPPLGVGECHPSGVALDDGRFLAWYCGQAAVLDRAGGTWTSLETPLTAQGLDDDVDPVMILGTPVAGEGLVYFAGAGHEGGGNALWRLDPALVRERP